MELRRSWQGLGLCGSRGDLKKGDFSEACSRSSSSFHPGVWDNHSVDNIHSQNIIKHFSARHVPLYYYICTYHLI